ncbi:MAG TPA: ABC transporter permease [Thermodesulfovibrionales bacterium]|nr:ABC transporter permease [Thermodesulfovibrionales bacterium]
MSAVQHDVEKRAVPELRFQRPDGKSLVVALSGDWKIENKLPSVDEVQKQIGSGTPVERLLFATEGLGGWDSGLLTFLTHIIGLCSGSNIPVEKEGLPQGVRRLLDLASAVPERKGARREAAKISFLEGVGGSAVAFWKATKEMLAFIGEALIAVLRFFAGKARFKRSDLFLTMQECGAQALPIVSLISLLVGLILAFVGAIQLKIFGAQIYVASLVGIAMVRVMGAVMTGIIMSGRTGAAFAAQLGTMQVNEEIDALQTMGFSAMEFLVLPRMLALVFMMPLLCLYADLMGILGGFLVGVGMLDLGVMEYFNQTKASVRLNDLWIGLFHGAVFGVIVALSGCLRGIQCGRSASAVGDATTSAVVTSIVSIIVATAIITVVCNVIGI